jgi:hypothetical protein
MTNNRMLTWGAAICALLLAIPFTAAARSAAIAKTTAKTPAEVRNVWPPETISGTIASVDPDTKLVIIETQDGVPFDMILTPATRIQSGGQRLKRSDLSQDINKNVSIRFVPERRGDVAQSIRIIG